MIDNNKNEKELPEDYYPPDYLPNEYIPDIAISRRFEAMEDAFKKQQMTVSERSLNYLFGRLNLRGIKSFRTGDKKLTYQTMWIVDCLAQKIREQHGLIKGRKRKPFYKDFVALRSWIESESEENIVKIMLKATEIRKMLDLSSNKLSVGKIEELVFDLTQVVIEMTSDKVLFISKTKRFANISIASTLFSRIKVEEQRLNFVSNRWKTRDIVFVFRFDTAVGKLFVHNLLSGGLTFLPIEMYKLSESAQNIWREMSLWKEPHERFNGAGYSLFELADIAGLKQSQPWSNKRKYVLRALKELERERFIEKYKERKVEDREVRFRYKIWKREWFPRLYY